MSGYITLEQAVGILKKGGVVAFPTETVYGLGAVAVNDQAVSAVYSAKNRPRDNPLICHFCSEAHIKEYVPDIPNYVDLLISTVSPGPISYLLPLPEGSPLKPATAGQNRVVCRVPDHSVALELIELTGRPIAAPSANSSGKVSPTNAQMVLKDLGDRIDGIVDGGSSFIGLESTIIDCTEKDTITVLRPGYFGVKELESIVDSPGFTETVGRKIQVRSAIGTEHSVTPGSKYKHYSPDTPVHLLRSAAELEGEPPYAVFLCKENLDQFGTSVEVFRDGKYKDQLTGNVYILLGSLEDIEGISRDFYRNIHSIDELEVDAGYFIDNDFGGTGLGESLRNRLSKIIG
jgi:L-threonylcarbamoyladenylate synthase